MKASYWWQLYITAHTWLFGIPFLFFPNQVLPWIGYEPTNEPWIRLAGMLFLVIGSTAITVFRHNIREMLLPSISIRLLVIVILAYLGMLSNSFFLYILAGIILIGVVGSSVCYYTELSEIKYS